MTTIGQLYLVQTRRPDGGWICYRTCDRREAEHLAAALGVRVAIEEP